MLKSMYEKAEQPGPYRAKMKKIAITGWSIIGGAIALMIAVSMIVDAGEPTAEDLYNAEILANAGNEETAVTSILTLEQGKDLLEKLGRIHPDLAKPRELRDARSTCYDLQSGGDIDLIWRTKERFGNGNDRLINDEQAAAIIELVRSNGFCDLSSSVQ